MYVYENKVTGLIDIYYAEPDESITHEEFDLRNQTNERQAKILEHINALKELGVNVVFEDNTAKVDHLEEKGPGEENVQNNSGEMPAKGLQRIRSW